MVLSTVSIFVTLVVSAAVLADAKCPSQIEPVTARVTQIFNGARTPYEWSVSPTGISGVVLPGAKRSCNAAFIAQHADGECEVGYSQQMHAPVAGQDSCDYSFSNGDQRVVSLHVVCDSSATSLVVAPEVTVASTATGHVFNFLAHHAGACEEEQSESGYFSDSNGVCPNKIPSFFASIPYEFIQNGTRTNATWAFSLTHPSTYAPPSGVSCGIVAHLTQHDSAGRCVAAFRDLADAEVTATGCTYYLNDASHIARVNLECDPTAQGEVHFQDVVLVKKTCGAKYRFDFFGRYAGVCKR